MVASSQSVRGKNEYTAQYAAAAMSDIRHRFVSIVNPGDIEMKLISLGA